MPRSALLLLVLAGLAAGGKPAADEVAHARAVLERDDRDGAAAAVETLARDGGHRSLQAIAEFGARTRSVSNTLLAGRALEKAAGETKALSLLAKLTRTYKRFPQTVARVATMAGQIPGKQTHAFLLKLAKEKRTPVAVAAIRALAARREEASRQPLLALLKSTRPAVSTAAAYALAELEPDPATMEALFKRAQRPLKERTGDACALALTRIEGAEEYGSRALALLIKRSSSDSFHALAKLALRLVRKPDPALLEQALAAPSPPVRELACDLIGLTRTPGFQKTLLRLAVSEHQWRNKVAAWLALRRTGIDEVAEGVKANIQKRGEPSYWAIQCALAHPHPAVLDALRAAALDTKDPVRRELAQRALRAASQDRAATRAFYLEVAASQRGTKRAQAALLGLGNLKDKESFHALVDLLEREPERRLDLMILKGLEKLTGHYYRPDPAIWREWFEVVDGQVSYEPKPIDRRKNRERVAKIKELGISSRTENAVESGLRWLARHQDLSGGWNGATYHENCVDGKACMKEGGLRDRPLAYTALAALAFQGAGYTHRDGPYRDVLQRAYEYILSNQDYDGSHNEKGWTFSYEAAVVCQALCDGYALTGDRWLGDGAQRMIDYLVKIQYPGRTWRYHVRSSETDTSVMSWILLACISARNAGLDIPEQIYVASEIWLNTAADPVPSNTFEVFVPDLFKKSNTYFIDVSRDEKGKLRHFKIKTWYQPPRLYTPAMSAIGLLARIWLGWTRAHPFCIGSANQVASQIPGYNDGLEGEFAFYPYTWYYGSMAMYQMGGRYWTRWKDKCIKDLLRNQHLAGCQHGSWEMPRGQLAGGLTGGTVYCTAMAILTLETFYRYQPYLARHDLRSREDPDQAGKVAEDAPAAPK